MNFNSIVKTAGIPLAGGLYSGLSRDESTTSFSGAFLRGTLLTGAGVTLSHAGNPVFAKKLSEMGGKKGIAARAAYVPAFLAHETMTWAKHHVLNPTKSMMGKAVKGNFKDITGMEGAATAFTAYSAYEGAGILESAGDQDFGGVIAGAAMFAAGKYAYMAGTYGAKAYAHRDEISKGYRAYKNSSADEQDLIKMLLKKTATSTSQKGATATSDFIMKGTIKSKEDIMMEMGSVGVDIMSDPQYQRTATSTYNKNSEKVMNAAKSMFGSTYHGGM